MRTEINLILNIPNGSVTATSLGVEGYARHRSPGSGKHFRGKTIMIDLALEGDRPAFRFYEEGGWRDAAGDAAAALAAVRSGKRTKTALSNDGFNITPLDAYRGIFLVKTGGAVLPLAPPRRLIDYLKHGCHEEMTPAQVARSIDRPVPESRAPRLFMILAPIQFLLLTNLAPEEYAWYATHRPGKIFRRLMFVELAAEQPQIAAASRFSDAREELAADPSKKTKSIVFGECLNDVPFRDWAGYRGDVPGGLYAGDRDGLSLWTFPPAVPRTWDRLDG
ncbi:MAG: hypothetical protein PHF93_03495 [Acidobacteriota bacterium]|nr:hypothetical protein [Acidobacteriota bacterium]MDD8032863.1 hypothetical protein [Acidobacteriota bacterium]MDW3226142.1 hypothetical protein [Acidobacteriota bacterium]